MKNRIVIILGVLVIAVVAIVYFYIFPKVIDTANSYNSILFAKSYAELERLGIEPNVAVKSYYEKEGNDLVIQIHLKSSEIKLIQPNAFARFFTEFKEVDLEEIFKNDRVLLIAYPTDTRQPQQTELLPSIFEELQKIGNKAVIENQRHNLIGSWETIEPDYHVILNRTPNGKNIFTYKMTKSKEEKSRRGNWYNTEKYYASCHEDNPVECDVYKIMSMSDKNSEMLLLKTNMSYLYTRVKK